jgi:sorbitol-specific phosphotransferase system component IIBC
MKPKEQFALALRIIGVLGIAYVLRTFVRNPCPSTFILIAQVVSVLIGAYFMRGAPVLLKFAYPESTPEPPDKKSA